MECVAFAGFLAVLLAVAIVASVRRMRAGRAARGAIAARHGWSYEPGVGRTLWTFAADGWRLEVRKGRRRADPNFNGRDATTWSAEVPTHGRPVVVGPQPPDFVRRLDPSGEKLVETLRRWLPDAEDPVREVVAVRTGHASLDAAYLASALDAADAERLLVPAAEAILSWGGGLRIAHVDGVLQVWVLGRVEREDELARLVAIGEALRGAVATERAAG